MPAGGVVNCSGSRKIRKIRIPLYCAGLKGSAKMTLADGSVKKALLDDSGTAVMDVTLPARGRVWMLFQ